MLKVFNRKIYSLSRNANISFRDLAILISVLANNYDTEGEVIIGLEKELTVRTKRQLEKKFL